MSGDGGWVRDEEKEEGEEELVGTEDGGVGTVTTDNYQHIYLDMCHTCPKRCFHIVFILG